ncbi:uncharacterized protein LOC135695319 isoform X3 [Rhopilema esculentum]|uniref:uncharacterized protein LOC135695319 isoform X3 n=1 Tax=Rhopilema esculentum TaxID=499914 RepID=UPI0031E31CB9
MEKLFLSSSTKKVLNLETELVKELKELKDEIEDAESLYSSGGKPFSSVAAPNDAEYFRNERKLALRKALKIQKAMPLCIKSEIMRQEMLSSSMDEYKRDSIGLILHQFFTEQVQCLAFCKAMHMLRWARICRDSKTIGGIYEQYMKRLDDIMKEQKDAILRSKRLAKCRDLSKRTVSLQYITTEDLLIYTRWLICHLHSVKHIHSFIRQLEWFPMTKLNQIHPDSGSEENSNGKSTKSQAILRSITRKLSMGKAFSPMKRNVTTFSDSSIPSAPALSYDVPKSTKYFGDVTSIAAASGGGLASDEVTLSIPLNDVDISSYSTVLDFLLCCYGIRMQTRDLKSRSDEMDMLHLVLRKFKTVYYDQEQMRHFPIYDTDIIGTSAKLTEQNKTVTYKKYCDWTDFMQIRPRIDGNETKNMTILKEKCLFDELLRINSQFFHVSDSQKALNCLREHANCVHEQTQLQAISVTTHRTGNDTTALWNKIFDYSNRRNSKPNKEPLGFEVKLSSGDIDSLDDSALDLSAAVEMLGLENEDQKRHPLANHGTYLAYLALRHLRIRDLQRTCLSVLNYFRSVERTLTIDDGGLVKNEDGFKIKKAEEREFLETLEIENQDDYYSLSDGRIHVQDHKGVFVIYDKSLEDFREIEKQLLLIGSHFISKFGGKDKNDIKVQQQQGSDFDLDAYSRKDIDRFGVILDLWTNEAAYLENKRKLVSGYFEIYQHIFNPKEKHTFAQMIADVIHERPRLDFSESYFIRTYRNECHCLRLRLGLIENIANKQVELQRDYVQKVNRQEESVFGMPLSVIPMQNISPIESRPTLRHIYLMEFHPSLALICKVTEALETTKKEFERIHRPTTTTQLISMEKRLYELAIEEFSKLKPVGHDYSSQVQRDIFSEAFIEDPLFVCTFAQSAMSLVNSKQKIKSVKEEKNASVLFWCKVLQILTLRHRLIECCDESSILSQVYKLKAKELGFDECHLFMRAVSFEFAQKKSDVETKPLSTAQLIQNDSVVDRYTPNTLFLAIQELDEKHLGSFSLRTQDGLLFLCQDENVERLKTTVLCQVVHKNLIASSLFQINNCLVAEKRNSLIPSLRNSANSVINDNTASSDDPFKSAKVLNAWKRKVQESFVSIQLEKGFLRNQMLNDFLAEKAVKGVIMNNIDEVIKLKRKMILLFCNKVHARMTQHALRSQIISYVYGLRDLLDDFPKTRDTHFVLGTYEEDSKTEENEVSVDPKKFTRRPLQTMSVDGKSLSNLWYLPHYREVLQMFAKLKEENLNARLTLILRLVSSLYDICQYLCSHARLGSAQARLGSKKLQFHGVTADWGGSEGIGAELREIQQQINNLEDPSDPSSVAKFLETKRDTMFLEFDIVVRHSARDTFLSAGNEKAFKSIVSCSNAAVRAISDVTRPSAYSFGFEVPDPLFSEDDTSFEICPWRTFLSRHGCFPLMEKPVHKIGSYMLQCLAGLEDIDRHVVNGEILSLSLLQEDALMHGAIDMTSLLNSNGDKELGDEEADASLTGSKEIIKVSESKKSQLKLSTKGKPMEALQFLNDFLILYSTLEQIKDDWACRKLGVSAVKSTKTYRSFMTIYKSDVMQVIFKQIAAKSGRDDDYDQNFLIGDNERLSLPTEVGEFEIKARQLLRLVESLECSMINDVTRRLSREQTLVIAERSRDDPHLPTDLWKKPSMKENIAVSRPHVLEDFISTLMSDHLSSEDSVTFSKNHLEKCLVDLSSETAQRERQAFEIYTGFYEGILRQQHQTLYLKEQEIKQAKSDSQSSVADHTVDVDCMMAEKCRALVLEITALRAKVSEMTDEIKEQENTLREKFKQDYNTLVIELFNNAFSMKNRFEQFRSCLYDDVFDCLGDVRKLAVHNMKKLREKSGQADAENNALSQRLIRAEQLREAQWESKNLLNMILKLRAFSHWNKTKTNSKSQVQLGKLRQQLTRVTKESLESTLVQEEKEILLKQEIASLRKALSQSERDCQILRKRLSNEHQVKLQKSNSQIQEAFSQRKIDLAKTANIEKLLQELELKDEKLRILSELTDRDNSVTKRSQAESKRALKQILNQLSHERSLKLDAFDRCDDLQKQIDEYEEHLELIARPLSSQSHHVSCFPSVPGGRTSPQRALVSARPHTHTAGRTSQRSRASRPQTSHWWTSAASPTPYSEGPKPRTKQDKASRFLESEKTTLRLKKKISDTLLTDFDNTDDY